MRFAVVGAMAGVVAFGGCQQADSILLVEVGGDQTLTLGQLQVTVTADGQMHAPILVPPSPTTITLPTSFTIELDRSINGPVTVAIQGWDNLSVTVALGSSTQTYINTGGTTIVAVTLVTGPPSP